MIIPFKNEKYANIIILKNGFSTLGAVYSHLYQNNEPQAYDNVWEKVWPDADKWWRNVTYKEISDYKTFFVWRDPYKRFISMYTDIVSGKMNHDGFYHHMNADRDTLMDVHSFVRICLPKIDYDIHLWKQSETIRMVGLIPDVMVDIKDLPEFIKNELKVDYSIIHNQSNNDVPISIFEQYREQIQTIYQSDYLLYKTYKDKLWKI